GPHPAQENQRPAADRPGPSVPHQAAFLAREAVICPRRPPLAAALIDLVLGDGGDARGDAGGEPPRGPVRVVAPSGVRVPIVGRLLAACAHRVPAQEITRATSSREVSPERAFA